MAENTETNNIASSGAGNDAAPRWKQPIRMCFAAPRSDRWERASRAADKSPSFAPLDDTLAELRLRRFALVPVRDVHDLHEAFRMRTVRPFLAALHHTIYDNALPVEACDDPGDANMLVLELGFVDRELKHLIGPKAHALPPPAVSVELEADPTRYVLTGLDVPYARLWIWHRDGAIAGVTLLFYYTYQWFVTECNALRRIREGASELSESYWVPRENSGPLDADLGSHHVNFGPDGVLTRDTTAIDGEVRLRQPLELKSAQTAYAFNFKSRHLMYWLLALLEAAAPDFRHFAEGTTSATQDVSRLIQEWWAHLNDPNLIVTEIAGLKAQVRSLYPTPDVHKLRPGHRALRSEWARRRDLDEAFPRALLSASSAIFGEADLHYGFYRLPYFMLDGTLASVPAWDAYCAEHLSAQLRRRMQAADYE